MGAEECLRRKRKDLTRRKTRVKEFVDAACGFVVRTKEL